MLISSKYLLSALSRHREQVRILGETARDLRNLFVLRENAVCSVSIQRYEVPVEAHFGGGFLLKTEGFHL